MIHYLVKGRLDLLIFLQTFHTGLYAVLRMEPWLPLFWVMPGLCQGSRISCLPLHVLSRGYMSSERPEKANRGHRGNPEIINNLEVPVLEAEGHQEVLLQLVPHGFS